MNPIVHTSQTDPGDDAVESDAVELDPATDDVPADDVPSDDDEPADDNEPDVDPKTRRLIRNLRRDARAADRRATDYGHRLHTHLVAASGRLEDPTDLPFARAHLDDPAALEAALDDLIARKPHLAARRTPVGDVGQGVTTAAPQVSLFDLMRGAVA